MYHAHNVVGGSEQLSMHLLLCSWLQFRGSQLVLVAYICMSFDKAWSVSGYQLVSRPDVQFQTRRQAQSLG